MSRGIQKTRSIIQGVFSDLGLKKFRFNMIRNALPVSKGLRTLKNVGFAHYVEVDSKQVI
jgi:hypothetical protein